MTDLRKLAEAATPGPWLPHRDMLTNDWQVHTEGDVIALVWGTEDSTGHDVAAFIAACSPDVIIALLDRAERAERELAEERHLATVRGEMLTACERERDAMDATIERLTAERMGAAMRAEAAERERDEARRMIRNLAARIDRDGGQRMDLDADLAETVTRLDGVVAQTYADMDEARAARDARPEITPEDAAVFAAMEGEHPERFGRSNSAVMRMRAALRTHAAKAKVKP